MDELEEVLEQLGTPRLRNEERLIQERYADIPGIDPQPEPDRAPRSDDAAPSAPDSPESP